MQMSSANLPFISYAQNQEDVIIWRAFKSVAQGFYIDIGAAHPIWESVTKAFYDRGWHGINIEPNPHFHAMLEQERPRDANLLALAGCESGARNLHIVGQSGLSTAAEESKRLLEERGHEVTSRIESKVVRLDDVLREHNVREIHFLKIDVEGMEVEVLRGCSLQEFRPKIIVVESTVPETNSRRDDGLRDFLLAYNYEFVFFDGLNDYFVAAECHALGALVSFPANPIDNYRTATQVDLESRLDHAIGRGGSTAKAGKKTAIRTSTEVVPARNTTENTTNKKTLQSRLFRRVSDFARTRSGKLSADDVRWAYKFFLGRHPEDDEVVLRHINACQNMKILVETITESEEYAFRKSHYVNSLIPQTDLHYFFHIYKTGGMSVNQYLSDSVPEGQLLPGFHVNELIRMTSSRRFRFLSGHFADLPLAYQSNHLKMATLLRNPVSRGWSHYKHLMRSPNPEFPTDQLNASPAKFLSGRYASLVFGDIQARSLARLSPDSEKFFHGMGDIKASRKELFELALDGLSRIELVGTTEHCDKFIEKLSEAWSLPPPSRSYRINTDPTGKDIYQLESELERVRELCTVDMQIYDHVTAACK